MIKIGILDTTLREGEQTPRVIFTENQRVRIAKMLSDAGVSMIEAGHPLVSEDIYNGIKRIMELKNTGEITSEIIGHSRAVASDIDSAASLNVDRIAIFYGISDLHLKYKTSKTREEVLKIIENSVSHASSYGLKVRFTAEYATRADMGFLRTVIETARDSGADRVSIADTVGILTPEKTKSLFNSIMDIKNIEYDIHAHNDLGMAVANSLTALESGATMVHSTVNGLGERVGITPTQVIAAAIKFHLNVDVMDLTKLAELSNTVEKYSGINNSVNMPITGKYAFTHKAGVHVAGIINNPETYEFMSPSNFNLTRNYTIDKFTGKNALKNKLQSMNINASEEDLIYILDLVKKSPNNFTDNDIVEIMKNIER